MKKVAFVLTTIAALTAAPLALAQEPNDNQDVEGDDSSTLPTPMSGDPSSVTTITSGEPTPAPAPMAPLRERGTIVARQSIRPHRPLLLTGASTLIGSYATTAALTAASGARGGHMDRDLYLPLVGPWMHLASVPEGMTDKLLIAGSGVVQGLGLGMCILSFFIPEKIPAATIEAHGVRVNLTATSFGKGSAGLGAIGEF